MSFYRSFHMGTPAIPAIPAIPKLPNSKLAGIARGLSPITRALAMLADACEGLTITPDELTTALGGDKAALDSGRLSQAQLRTFAEVVVERHEREAGRRPKGWTQAARCQLCGPVYLLPLKREDDAPDCPWCHNRLAGFAADDDGRPIEARPIPRPGKVRCADCEHWTADVIGDGTGIGTCAYGGPIWTDMPAYPNVQRWCSVFAQRADPTTSNNTPHNNLIFMPRPK